MESMEVFVFNLCFIGWRNITCVTENNKKKEVKIDSIEDRWEI